MRLGLIFGHSPFNKKIRRILAKFSYFWKFPQIFKMCFYQNILRKIFKNLSSQLHQNISSENLSDFLKKLWVQNSQIFVRKFFRTQIFVDRTKPWWVCWWLEGLETWAGLTKTIHTIKCQKKTPRPGFEPTIHGSQSLWSTS